MSATSHRTTVRLTVLTVLAFATAPSLAGAATAHLRIIGGYAPEARQWPWMTALVDAARGPDDYRQHFCGGALVQHRLVVTAAHCVADKSTGRVRTTAGFSVLLGKRNLLATGGERLPVERVAVHPDYGKKNGHDHDVAVLHLGASSSAQPAALLGTQASLTAGHRVTTMGWGVVQSGGQDVYAEHLKAVDTAIWSDAQCQAAGINEADRGWYRWIYDPGSMICAGYADSEEITCQGDSGGPMMIPDTSGTWRLVGIVSWGGIGCYGRTNPTVYAWLGAPALDGFVREHIRQAEAAAPSRSAQPAAPLPGVQPVGRATRPRSGSAPRVTLGVRMARMSVRAGRPIGMRVTIGRAGRLVVTARRGSRVARSWRIRVPRAGTYVLSLPARAAGRSLRPGTYGVRIVLRTATGSSIAVERGLRVR